MPRHSRPQATSPATSANGTSARVRAGNPTSPGSNGFDQWISSPNFYENDPLMSHKGSVLNLKGESSQATVATAISFLRNCARANKPFLAVIWFGNPHTPHVPVPELAKMYEDQPKELQNYYAEITGIDLAMGQLRDELSSLGLRDNTLLWYTSDNGAAKPGSTGGLRGMKGSLWEGGVRVPGIIEWPDRIKTPRHTSLPACTVDIYPTLLEIAGAKVANQPVLDGISLVPLIDGKMETRPKPLGFWVYPEPGQGVNSSGWLSAMKKEEQNGTSAPSESESEPKPWTKLVPEDDRRGHAVWLDGNFKLHHVPGGFELYDLTADPKEEKDIAAGNADRVAKMKADLERWQQSVIRSLNGADYKK